MKKRNLYLTVLALSAAFSWSLPAFAKEFTTSDSVLTIDTPDDGWAQIKDNATLATLTNGKDFITLEHYSNGEKLPNITVADDTYEKVCQNIISTRNEVFLITGLAADEKDFDEIQKAVQSAVINIYDTKKAVTPSDSGKISSDSNAGINASSNSSDASYSTNISTDSNSASDGTNTASNSNCTSSGNDSTQETNTAPTSDSSVDESISFTGWITGANVNVRNSASTDTSIVSTVPYGNSVAVTGAVSTNGAISWYRVDLNGVTGFISSQYVSEAAPTAEQNGITLTDEQLTLYTSDYTGATYINKATDGNWYDGTGRQYVLSSGDSWSRVCDGSIWTDISQAVPDANASQTITVTDSDGLNEMTLYLDADSGIWHNSAWGVYTDNGNNTFTGPDGSVWTVNS